jgi:hypothetical protein
VPRVARAIELAHPARTEAAEKVVMREALEHGAAQL